MKSDKPFRVVAGLTMELARRYIALVKWRNQLLALLCLAVFAGLGVLYFQHWVVQKPFGIILIIGEGLAPERIALTRVYLGGSDAHLALDGMPHLALVTNHSRDFAISVWNVAKTALMSSGAERSWNLFRFGVGRSFSAHLQTEITTAARVRLGVTNRLCPIWCDAPLNCCNTISAVTCSLSTPPACEKQPKQITRKKL